MTIAVLYPRVEYAEIGERYASWRTRSRLRRADEVSAVVHYEPDEAARDVVADVAEQHVLVVLDPLVTIEPDIATRLRDEHRPGNVVAPAQSELLLYFCETEMLRNERRVLARAIDGREVITAATVSVLKWQRAAAPDLLPFVPTTARSVLHVGCGDGTLGEQIKQRQRCRVAGVESDRDIAFAAKRRLDDVYIGEYAEVVSILHDKFDCIVTSGVLEQTFDPWSLLGDLRRISASGATLVAAIPNVGNAQAVADLQEGHFAVADQMRFFTRESVHDLIDIAGWTLDRIEPLLQTQFIVVARNERS